MQILSKIRGNPYRNCLLKHTISGNTLISDLGNSVINNEYPTCITRYLKIKIELKRVEKWNAVKGDSRKPLCETRYL